MYFIFWFHSSDSYTFVNFHVSILLKGHCSSSSVSLETYPLMSSKEGKEIQPVHPEGNQSWIFIERTDAEAEIPVLWLPDVEVWLIGKNSDARKDWGQEEKGTTEDEMVGWHHQLDGHEFEWAPGVGDGQGSLACYSPWGRNVRHDWMTELNWGFQCGGIAFVF